MRESWEKIAIDNKVEDFVKFVGYIPEAELPKYYTMSDVFVMPSIEIEGKGDIEGFGITFLEANACGKPVIGGSSGGISDAVIDGETGVLINPYDDEEIKEAILRLLKDEEYSKSLGDNGRKRVEEELSWLKIAGKISKEIFDI